MGQKFRKKVAAGQNNKAILKLTQQLRQLAGYLQLTSSTQQVVTRALIEHLGCEEQIKTIVAKYQAAAQAASEQTTPVVTAAEVNGGPVAPDSKFTDDTPVVFSSEPPFKQRYTQPIDHEHTWDVCGFDEGDASHMGHCDHGLHGCDCAVCRTEYAERIADT